MEPSTKGYALVGVAVVAVLILLIVLMTADLEKAEKALVWLLLAALPVGLAFLGGKYAAKAAAP